MIREYRIKKGYTLEELAEKCDISWRNLQRIENGKYNVAKFETIKKILLVLEFSDKDLVKFMKI
ncbi:MAG: helix-turn-helix transcriptional regulator [Bacilli bacterium]|nr:helix-turn-helix transcriptional regulator [Bacilli bacterium]